MHIFTVKSQVKLQDLLDNSENQSHQDSFTSVCDESLKKKAIQSFDNNLFSKAKMSKYKSTALVPANLVATTSSKPMQSLKMNQSNFSFNKENTNFDERLKYDSYEANRTLAQIDQNQTNLIKPNSPNTFYQLNHTLRHASSSFTPDTYLNMNSKPERSLHLNNSASTMQLQSSSYKKPNTVVLNPNLSQGDSYLVRKLKKEVQLSPKSKAYFHELEKIRKEQQNKSNFDILTETLKILPDIQSKSLWKVFFDLAESFKKDYNYTDSKTFYILSIYLQPYNSDTWLEFAKMEEDYGNLIKAKEILKRAIDYNQFNENLIIKFLRIEEKLGKIQDSRKILSGLKYQSFEKNWKLYLEGALLESKYGNPKSAERIFKALVKNIEPQGGVYLEYAKFEENLGNLNEALKICFEGISKNIRFSNLWTYFLKISERVVENINHIPLSKFLGYAINSLPRDMVWKIYLEIASFTERKMRLEDSKTFISKAIISCPENVKWKCFIMGARVELKNKNNFKAKKIINYCLNNNTEKQKAQLMIEASKIYEYQGEIDKAIQYFEYNQDYMRSEWKVYLEYIHMLIRNRRIKLAQEVVLESLRYHNLAGRLWASIIQLNHLSGKENGGNNAYRIFLIAINEVPKSGEVW